MIKNNIFEKNYNLIDKKALKAIEMIENTIKGTAFEGNVYLCGESLKGMIIGEPFESLDFVVTIKNGGIVFAEWLSKKLANRHRPVCNPKGGYAFLNIYFGSKDYISISSSKVDGYGEDDVALESDATFRRLTIDAIYYNISSGEIIDPTEQGLKDLESKILRCPSSPDFLFYDDPIQMLSIIRESSKEGWGIEKNTWLSIIKNSHLITQADEEELAEEAIKLATSVKPSLGMRRLYACGMLKGVFADTYEMTKKFVSNRNDETIFEHCIKVMDLVTPTEASRLSALYHHLSETVSSSPSVQAQDMMSSELCELSLYNLMVGASTLASIKCAIRNHRAFHAYGDTIPKTNHVLNKFIKKCGDFLPTVLDLMNANNLTELPPKTNQVKIIIDRIKEAGRAEEEAKNKALNKLPINGNDIIERLCLKKKEKPLVGYILKEIEKKFKKDRTMTKEDCLDLAEDLALDILNSASSNYKTSKKKK